MLIDRFGRRHTYLRVSLTDRCNLRCHYCMPHEGMRFEPPANLLTDSEILRVCRVLAGMGITKIRLTGGEPLLRASAIDLASQLSALPGIRTLALTTNGYLLESNAQSLKAAGVSALNVSLDTFCPDTFTQIARRPATDLAVIRRGLDAALNTDFDSLKLNMVVMGGVNDSEILDFVAFAADKPLNVRFIEYMPFKSTDWQAGQLIKSADIKARIEEHYELIPIATKPSAVARDYEIRGHQGTVSFISSMSDSFCATCNRLRLTADGSLKSCLFAPAEVSIRDRLRSGMTDADLSEVLRHVMMLKPEAHPPVEVLSTLQDNRPMIAIGG